MLKNILKFSIFVVIATCFICGAKDPLDSFDNLNQYRVGIIVAGADTSTSPTDAYGTAWYNYFKELNFNVLKIDTSRCAYNTYDGLNNWSSLDFVVFIPTTDYDSLVTIDTTTSDGLRDVPIIAMHQDVIERLGLGTTNYINKVFEYQFGYDSSAFPINYTNSYDNNPLYENSNFYLLSSSDSSSNVKNNLVLVNSSDSTFYDSEIGTVGDGNDQFRIPWGIVNYQDTLYVVDHSNSRVMKRDPSDLSYISKFGSEGSGNDQFDSPTSIVVYGSYMYIVDRDNDRIIKRTLDYTYSTKLGSSGSGNDQFDVPYGITHDGSYLYVSDGGSNDRITKRLMTNLSYISKIGSSGSGNDEFNDPVGLSNDGTYLYVCDYGNDRVVKRLLSDLSYVSEFSVLNPYGIDHYNGRLYVTSLSGSPIPLRVYNATTLVEEFTSCVYIAPGLSGRDTLYNPYDLSIVSDTLYISDSRNHRLMKRYINLAEGLIAKIDTITSSLRLVFSASDVYPYTFSPYASRQTQGYYSEYDALTVLNRTISLIIGTNTDSLFRFAGSGSYSSETNTDPVKNYLEINGHRVGQADILRSDGYADDVTYNSSERWDSTDAVYFFEDGLNYLDKDNLDSLITKGLAVGSGATTWFNIGATINTETYDSLFENGTTRFVLKTSAEDSLDQFSDTNENYGIYFSAGSGQTLNDFQIIYNSLSDKPKIINEKGNSKIGYITKWNENTPSNYTPNDWTNDLWDVISKLFGYLFVPKLLNPPTSVTATAISSDSISVSWTDNETGELAYGIYVYSPKGFWFTRSLAVDTESDTLFPFWPPNEEIILDVAAIDGTNNDTLFSGVPDTVYTLALEPPTPYVTALGDSTLKIVINGYLFRDAFTDTNELRHANAVWTEVTGTWDNDYPNQIMEIETASGGVASTAYSKEIRDVEMWVSYALSDSSLFSSQYIEFYIMANNSSLNDDGYYVKAEYDSLTFYRMDNGSSISLLSVSVEGENSHWHDIKVVRDWYEIPVDTIVTWTLYWDGTNKGSVRDSTYTSSSYMGLKASHSGQHFDNFYTRCLWPSGNHRLTKYAVQDSVSGQYVNINTYPSTLTASAIWGTYAQYDSLSGDTLAGLTPSSIKHIRSKAKSGR